MKNQTKQHKGFGFLVIFGLLNTSHVMSDDASYATNPFEGFGRKLAEMKESKLLGKDVKSVDETGYTRVYPVSVPSLLTESTIEGDEKLDQNKVPMKTEEGLDERSSPRVEGQVSHLGDGSPVLEDDGYTVSETLISEPLIVEMIEKDYVTEMVKEVDIEDESKIEKTLGLDEGDTAAVSMELPSPNFGGVVGSAFFPSKGYKQLEEGAVRIEMSSSVIFENMRLVGRGAAYDSEAATFRQQINVKYGLSGLTLDGSLSVAQHSGEITLGDSVTHESLIESGDISGGLENLGVGVSAPFPFDPSMIFHASSSIPMGKSIGFYGGDGVAFDMGVSYTLDRWIGSLGWTDQGKLNLSGSDFNLKSTYHGQLAYQLRGLPFSFESMLSLYWSTSPIKDIFSDQKNLYQLFYSVSRPWGHRSVNGQLYFGLSHGDPSFGLQFTIDQ